MSQSQLISTLSEFQAKPVLWRVLQSIDSTYHLEFTYNTNQNPEFLPILKRGNTLKSYKSMNAIFADISKVQNDAMIHFIGKQFT
jgi:hypothetical protein